ncbi:MAG TPA: hypothetical protein VE982_06615 [Gaiellaceae bacterium]|nr:hypothetical protein [Gaiellaceae bacterium]
MSKGPLAVAWGAPPELAPQAGTLAHVRLEVANAGTVAWHDGVNVAYHWLDARDNPIVWDGVRTAAPRLRPGERTTVDVTVRSPIPPGPYRLAFDLVAENRAWFSELGNPMLALDLVVAPREGEPSTSLPEGVEPAPGWRDHVRAAHADGYGVVAGSIEWHGGLLHPRPRALAPYVPGGGRVPGFDAPLLCPSVLPGIELERLGDVAGLPAFAAPRDEPWIYDGRAVLRARPRSGRRRT